MGAKLAFGCETAFRFSPFFASKSSKNLQEENGKQAYFDRLRLHSLIPLSKYTTAKDANMLKRVNLPVQKVFAGQKIQQTTLVDDNLSFSKTCNRKAM